MIKSAKELISDILSSPEGKEEVVKEYAFSIIKECMGNFECTMEESSELEEESVTFEDKTKITHLYPKEVPVLVRASILKVKEQIK